MTGHGQLGIAVASGMLKGVFGHGVLSAFEEAGVRAGVYGVASSSTLSGGLAAAGQARAVGAGYWQRAAQGAASHGMSRVVLDSLAEYGPVLRAGLFSPGAPRFLLAVSRVTTAQAAELTQGPGARALGKQLLKNVFAGDREWVDQNLATEIFDSGAGEPRLTGENFDEVAYASTRMLHAWDIPASIAGTAYVDASYTCACPAREVAQTGCAVLVVIGADPFPVFRDLYASEEIVDGSTLGGATVRVIKPAEDLGGLGVSYASATAAGIDAAYQLGLDAGKDFLQRHGDLLGPPPATGPAVSAAGPR